MKNGMKLDYTTRNIIVSAAFLKKASEFGSEEYNALLAAKKDYPDYTLTKEAKPKKNSSPLIVEPSEEEKEERDKERMIKRLKVSAANMEAFIENYHPEDKDEFAKVQAYATACGAKYQNTLKWFRNKYGEEFYEQFYLKTPETVAADRNNDEVA